MLLVGATLLARTFLQLMRIDPGFDPRGLAIATIECRPGNIQQQVPDGSSSAALIERVRALPGVAGVSRNSGGGVSFGLTFEVEGRGVVLDDPTIEVPHSYVADDYFSVMRIPITAGRGFNADDVAGAPRAVVINQAMASRLWNGSERRRSAFPDGHAPSRSLVYRRRHSWRHLRTTTHRRKPHSPSTRPLRQTGTGAGRPMVARTTGDPARLLPLIREQVRSLDEGQPIWKLRTGATEYAEFLALPRFNALLMGALAGLGVVIAAVGL